jgi:hypothetical protein
MAPGPAPGSFFSLSRKVSDIEHQAEAGTESAFANRDIPAAENKEWRDAHTVEGME